MDKQIWTDLDLIKVAVCVLLVGIVIGIGVGYEMAYEPVKVEYRPLRG